MKSEKENYYIKEILKILVQGDIVATGKIASMMLFRKRQPEISWSTCKTIYRRISSAPLKRSRVSESG